MTVGIYIRVSTLEQANEGYSIAAQRERLKAYCMAQGWDDFKFYVDEGVSAKDTNRPQLSLLLNHIKNGSISMILVYRLDRFTRSVSDLYNLLQTLDKHDCTFKSATEIYDTSTAMGRMFIGLVALLAQWETENLSERIKMALEKKVAEGERVGNIPFGFDLSEDEKLVKNNKSAIVLDMIKKVESGMSANQVATFLNKTNNDRARWHTQGVLRILKNPALYGATRWNDQIHENTHEGIISKAKYLKLQQILSDRAKHHRREVENTYLFQGVLICPECGNPLSVNRYIRKKKDGTESQGAVYRCQLCWKEHGKMDTIGEYRFEDALKDYLKNFEIKHLEPVKDESDVSLNHEQLLHIEKKREKYQRAWASDLMSDDEFKKLMNETRNVYEELKAKVEESPTPIVVDLNELKNIVNSFNTNFFSLTQEEKRIFISNFIRKIEFKIIPQQPKRPDKSKKGKALIVITNVNFH
ncbi:recombinase family protein [Peribacillus butanolivorans]|uniref:recombinase family protein n=1 Tax=Peribacillus butanolivorans TaxID=421767 RepID=UPI00382D3DDC